MRKYATAFATMMVCFTMVLPAEAAKNVILIIPDGCSTPMWAAVRAMTVGVDGLLNIDRLPVQGRCRTYSADALVTDSAASGTTYACGVKTNNGILGCDRSTVFGDSLTQKPVSSILELARKAGYSTGLITTTLLCHATPAAFYTHRANRSWYDQISGDLVGKGIDVLMGGGRDYFIPKGAIDEEGSPSKRNDSRNIIQELRNQGYAYAYDTAGFKQIDPLKTDKLLCLFNAGDMQFEYNRAKDKAGEPGLWEQTAKALQILSRNKKGFFLMVESGIVDHAAHSHLTREFLWEGAACDKTVGVAMDFARKNRDTLKGEQEIFYITGGKGVVTAGGKSYDLSDGIAFLAPEGLEFTMTATGDEPLTMFLVCEPVLPGFTPRKDLAVKNENTFPIGTKDGHWVYQERDLFTEADGLSVLHAVITLTQDPMTIGHPHFHVAGCEEIWTTIKGENFAFLGKQLRHQPPGTAYMIPPDGKTNHSNLNQSKTDQIKMLYIATRNDIKK